MCDDPKPQVECPKYRGKRIITSAYTFHTVMNGGILLNKDSRCPKCHGTGKVDEEMSDELKACPTCKGEPKIYKVGGWYKLQCIECLTTTPECFTEAEAIELWNTRPLEDALLADKERAEAMVERMIDAGRIIDGNYYGDWGKILGYKSVPASLLVFRALADEWEEQK